MNTRTIVLVSVAMICAAAKADSPLDEAKPGMQVKVTTSVDTVVGQVANTDDKDFIKINDAATGETVILRRSSIQSLHLISERGAPGATVNPTRHVVYVHGICTHAAGFSRDWWSAMKPFVPSISQDNVHEVVWSDIVNAPGAPPVQFNDEEQRLHEQLRNILEDRSFQESEGAAEEAPGGLIGDFMGCADDFVLYMTREGIRNQILARFDRVVEPLLQNGAQVEVISHSWGTVVAYEALRRMEQRPRPTGRVKDLFIVGSALSIGPVKHNLQSRFSGGKKPEIVSRWINLDAAFDLVGGRVKGLPYAVDVERINLPAVGCSFIASPVCAHSSYFVPENILVNRDLFGFHINN